jgi:hypothetical protein
MKLVLGPIGCLKLPGTLQHVKYIHTHTHSVAHKNAAFVDSALKKGLTSALIRIIIHVIRVQKRLPSRYLDRLKDVAMLQADLQKSMYR